MALVKCKECGKDISSMAKVCPYCGYKKNKGGCIKLFLGILLGIIGLSIVISIISPKKDSQNSVSNSSILKTELNYLNEIEEVDWVTIDDNNVYIGFNEIPSDLQVICNAAAFKGNKAINFGVHVWAVDARRYGRNWEPGEGSYIYEVTYRYGKME